MRRKIDLTGQRFGRLTVIEQTEKPDEYSTYTSLFWRCRCDCGGEIVVNGGNLKAGRTRSCGCLKREAIAKARLARRARV